MDLNIYSLSPLEVITKDMLSKVSGIKPRTLSKRLAALEPELKKLSPHYNKNCSQLTPKEAFYIIEELGLSYEGMKKKYHEITHPNKSI